MIITNKITGRDVTKEWFALLEGRITNKEFEVITLTPPKINNYGTQKYLLTQNIIQSIQKTLEFTKL